MGRILGAAEPVLLIAVLLLCTAYLVDGSLPSLFVFPVLGGDSLKKRPFAPGLLLVAGAWLFLSVFCWLKPDGEISFSERRKLAEFPELSRRSILSGKFASDFEAYSLDQFPARDSFRTLQSLSAFYLFGQMDNHGIYLQEGICRGNRVSFGQIFGGSSGGKTEKLV